MNGTLSSLRRVSKKTVIPILIGAALSIPVRLLFPSAPLVNLISNMLLLIPSVILALSQTSWRRALNIVAVYLFIVGLGYWLVGGIAAGAAGLMQPAFYGANGTISVTHCNSNDDCIGHLVTDSMSGDVSLPAHPGASLAVGDQSTVKAYLISGLLPEQNGNNLQLDFHDRSDPPPIAKALSICLGVLAAWILGIIGLRHWIRRKNGGQISQVWDPLTAPFRGERFGKACLWIGSVASVVAFVAAVVAFGRDLSEPVEAEPFLLGGLATGDWLTVLGCALAVVAWGLPEAHWRIGRRRVVQAFYAISALYMLVLLIVASMSATKWALGVLQMHELKPFEDPVLASLARASKVLSPGLILANLAVAVTLLVLTLQVAQPQIKPNSSSQLRRAHWFALFRRRGVFEVLTCLSAESMTVLQVLKGIRNDQAKSAVTAVLETLCDEGLARCKQSSKDTDSAIYYLTSAGFSARESIEVLAALDY